MIETLTRREVGRLKRLRAELLRERVRLRLRTLEESIDWLGRLGLILEGPDPDLPSLFAAAGGRPAANGRPGSGSWPRRARLWSGALARDRNVLALGIVRGRTAFLHRAAWTDLDALIRPWAEALIAKPTPPFGRPAHRLVRALARQGPLPAVDLRRLTRLDRRDFDRARRELERHGVLIVERFADEGGRRPAASLKLWTQALRRPRGGAGRPGVAGARLAVGLHALEAAVYAPPAHVDRWFAWERGGRPRLGERLRAAGVAALGEVDERPVLIAARHLDAVARW